VYKPRNYLTKEFPELLAPNREAVEVLELGCGYGSAIFPILAESPNVHAQVSSKTPRTMPRGVALSCAM